MHFFFMLKVHMNLIYTFHIVKIKKIKNWNEYFKFSTALKFWEKKKSTKGNMTNIITSLYVAMLMLELGK